jgi:hypothetical protein
MEIWKAIPGFERYEVSNIGNVRRASSGRGTRANRPIKPSMDKGGRLVFNASADQGRKQFKVHRAVMLAFVGECPQGKEVAHLDGNQTNNCLENLMYATPKENNGHKVLHGTQWKGETAPQAKLSEADARWIKQKRGSISYSVMAASLGVHLQTVAAIAQGKNWKHV